MFPESITNEETSTSENTYNVISDSQTIRKTPDYDFENKHTVVTDGNTVLVDDYQNVRNWIIKFFLTPIDKVPIYQGTGFGTSAYKLRGYKSISGLMYAQIKSEIEQGFKLNPNILQVLDVGLEKEETSLVMSAKVKLKDGYILEEKTEVFNLV